MTIHHDKSAYGRLASSREDVSEERLLEMLKNLNGTLSGEQLPEGTDTIEEKDGESKPKLDKDKKKGK